MTTKRNQPAPIRPGVQGALDVTLGAVATTPADAAVVELARFLAGVLDSLDGEQRATVTPQVSGQLLRVLGELGATPAARAKATARGSAGFQAPNQESTLDRLRREHRRYKH